VLKNYIWGGRRLAELGRDLPRGVKIAESWEISGHEVGETLVINGRYKGWTLTDLMGELGRDLVGTQNASACETHKFPLLVKILDAQRRLSVQVHPNDDYAFRHENNELGKTEMWVVLDAEPDAEVVLGVKKDVSRDALRKAIERNDVESSLHRIGVSAGDHICVPAGMLHAILGGILIIEVQQASNTTYRVYDWNRTGSGGRPRPLHVDKALDVIDFENTEPSLRQAELLETGDRYKRWRLWSTPYFTVERVELEAGGVYDGICDGRSMEIWGLLAGKAAVNRELELDAVQFVLLPAAMGAYIINACDSAQLLRIYVE